MIAHTGQRSRLPARGPGPFLFSLGEKRNGPGLQREKMGLMIVGLSLSPSAARIYRIARGRCRHWAAQCRTGNKVVLLLLPPRPPLGRKTETAFNLSLNCFNQAKNSPDGVSWKRLFFVTRKAKKWERWVEWWKVKGKENGSLVLVPRGGRGGCNRNDTCICEPGHAAQWRHLPLAILSFRAAEWKKEGQQY